MAAAFGLLRARELLWTPAVNSYLRGKRDTPNDLMAWNADGTRMPCRMHSEYLRELYLNNALALGQFRAQGQRIDLKAIRLPLFVVGTETDHVAPWRSVYKVRALTRSPDYTFLLTSGGHNAGIVSGPTHPRRRYRQLTWHDTDESLGAEAWLERAPLHQGSWWPAWQQWLAEHSSAGHAPPRLGDQEQSMDAPGSYVLQR
jgi:polyhydroxyalkanoate synthase